MPLSNPSQGGVSTVLATPPLISSGGTSPEISFDSSTPNGVYSLTVNSGVFSLIQTVGETVGSVKAFATTSIPTNYLWCNGASVLITTYPDLFDVIGITYGGDGITNFNLPNLTDRFIKGDNGSNIGAETGSNILTVGQLPLHNHNPQIAVDNTNSSRDLPGDNYLGQGGSYSGTFSGDFLAGVSDSSIGNGEAHEHPNLTLRYAICFESIGVNTSGSTPSFSQTLAVNNDSNIRAQFNGVNYLTENEVLNYVFENGLTLTTDTVELGGSLLHDTVIDGEYLLDIKSNFLDYGASTSVNIGFRIGEDVEDSSPSSSLYAIDNINFNKAVVLTSVDPFTGDSPYTKNLIFDKASNTTNLLLLNAQQIRLSTDGDTLIHIGNSDTVSVGTRALLIRQIGDSTYVDNDAGEGLVYTGTAFYTGLAIEANFDYTGLVYNSLTPKKYVDDSISTAIVSGLIVEQIHTSGPTVIINDNTTILYVDPISTIASLTVILPENPINGQEVKVSFGGTIALGAVCTALAVTGNTGQLVLGGVTITTADVGDGYIFKFQSSTSLWRIF